MNKLKKNLILTGMMGSGKTTIGKNLSYRLKMKFADTDHNIEKKLSLTISEIFEKKGEKFFRKIEKDEVLKIIEKSGFVISLGGGAFMNKTIRENVKRNSISVWLDVKGNMLQQRTIMNKKRPLLKNINKQDFLKLYEERKKIYSLSDYRIDCTSKKKEEIIKEIEKIYENS
ncbi:MAG: shikimate kinase [Candidatus Pelagibacter sp.]|nr:shikimate kinase [Candidatus Pelagibacter sp.]